MKEVFIYLSRLLRLSALVIALQKKFSKNSDETFETKTKTKFTEREAQFARNISKSALSALKMMK